MASQQPQQNSGASAPTGATSMYQSIYQQQAQQGGHYPQQAHQGGGYQAQPQYGQQQPQQGGYQQGAYQGQQQQQFGGPPAGGYYAPPPPQPMYYPQPMVVPTPPAVSAHDEDYYKGFHDGVVRNTGARIGSAISWVAPLVINIAFFVGPIWYIRRKYAQSMASAAASTATGKDGKKPAGMGSFMEMMMPMKPKQYRVDVKGTKFQDVIGIPEAKEDLKQYVDFLKEPAKFTRLGARLPKGCLLTGQPGTGKTLLARAVAGEADTPFFTCSGADFIEIFGGSGPKRVRELFAEARAAAPCVVFIDEIDAIGSRNSGRQMGGGGSSEENRTINQLLAELDGLTSKEAIVVIAATNYVDAIDKALLREGRFDRKVNIPMPDKAARSELFEFYLNQIITGDVNCKPKVTVIKPRQSTEGEDGKKETVATPAPEPTPAPLPVPVVDGVSNKAYAEALSERTPGVSPAQIATIVNEAALTAAVKDDAIVPLKDLQDAIDDVLIGKKHRQRMSEASLKRTAYHECGHAIMAWLSPLQKDVVKVSIIPRGRAGGYTQQVQDEALEPHTDQFLFSQLCVLLGGRVAERLILGDISTGALDDLQRATKIAMDKLLTYGMSKQIGQLAFKQNERNDGRAWMNYSEDLHAKVEAEARELVNKAYRHTLETLTANQKQLHDLGGLLLEKKELMKDDIVKIMGPKVSS